VELKRYAFQRDHAFKSKQTRSPENCERQSPYGLAVWLGRPVLGSLGREKRHRGSSGRPWSEATWALTSSTTPRELHAAIRACTMSHIRINCVMWLAPELGWCRCVQDTTAACLLTACSNVEELVNTHETFGCESTRRFAPTV
jgi:hypothetical protein